MTIKTPEGKPSSGREIAWVSLIVGIVVSTIGLAFCIGEEWLGIHGNLGMPVLSIGVGMGALGGGGTHAATSYFETQQMSFSSRVTQPPREGPP